MLDNIPHINGVLDHDDSQDCANCAAFGADDIDGTVVEEKIYHDAGATRASRCAAASCCN